MRTSPISVKICVAMDVKNNLSFILFVLFQCFSLKSILSLGADTISANHSLSGDQTILSAAGVFKLGFFQPGNSSNYYLGMWYDKVPAQTIVWVANRERPISEKYSSQLKILNGNLVLLDESQIPIWSTNSSSTISNSVEAVLLDTGNLVLRDGSNSSEPLWQSFDHPTDTWLPGGKIGFDNRTNTSYLLTSWKNSHDPSPSLYSFEANTTGSGECFMRWNRSEKYWTTGTWNGRFFSLIPETKLNDHLSYFSYVSNENESYFTNILYNATTLTRLLFDVSGQIKRFIWSESTKEWTYYWSQPKQQCDVYAFCGTFGNCNQNSMPFCECVMGFEPKFVNEWNLNDFSGGCVRKTPLLCQKNTTENGERDRFFAGSSMVWPKQAQSVTVGSAAECKSTCFNNCSCTAYAYDSNGCSIWFGDLLNLQQLSEDDSEGKTLYIRLAASEFRSSANNTRKVIGIVLGPTAGVVVLIGIVLVVFWRLRRSNREAKTLDGSLVLFGYRDLQNATNNFTEKLGEGGFGSVFKGQLPDSTVIAVKKLEGIRQGEKQFRTEISTIGTIQHVNIVQLRGFCSKGTEKLLVFEYMPNSSLDAHLFHEKDVKILDWKTRYQIALGTARGLVYLHEKCRDCIIHCDIKPENILLDAEFCPKVADFGLAKLVGRDFSRVLTTMRGTRGYLAPEWISGVAITTKADVYSYGMVLFELISGMRNSKQSEEGKYFPTFVATKIAEGEDILSLLDQRLEGNADVEELVRVCKIACWCIQDDETQRPSMSQVVQILERLLDVSLPPIPRDLQLLVDSQGSQAWSNSLAFASHTKSITSTASSKS